MCPSIHPQTPTVNLMQEKLGSIFFVFLQRLKKEYSLSNIEDRTFCVAKIVNDFQPSFTISAKSTILDL